MMYAKYDLEIPESTHEPSVVIYCRSAGGEIPTSQMPRNDCVQNTASVEFCDRFTLMFLLIRPLPEDLEALIISLREISSRLSDSTPEVDRELVSPELLVSLLDKVSLVFHFDLCFSESGNWIS